MSDTPNNLQGKGHWHGAVVAERVKAIFADAREKSDDESEQLKFISKAFTAEFKKWQSTVGLLRAKVSEYLKVGIVQTLFRAEVSGKRLEEVCEDGAFQSAVILNTDTQKPNTVGSDLISLAEQELGALGKAFSDWKTKESEKLKKLGLI